MFAAFKKQSNKSVIEQEVASATSFKSNFLSQEQAEKLAKLHGTPLFVYSKKMLIEQAKIFLDVAAPFGLTARYAMKANSNPEVLNIFRDQGLSIDASSGYEAEIAIQNGFEPKQILLTSQQLAHNLKDLVNKGVQFNATSLHQLEVYGQTFPSSEVSVRINPGIGSGHSAKTNVGGLTSSFGIWHEYFPQIHEISMKYDLKVMRMHTHIGAGTEPSVWREAAQISLGFMNEFPEASIINLGGGFKVGRMDHEKPSDMAGVSEVIQEELQRFYSQTGRQLKLELEPGTFMIANAGVLLSRINDIVDTGADGYNFIKLDTGMNDILRPSLYGSQHPIAVLNNSAEKKDYVVVGHNCESGDLLTTVPGEPEIMEPRLLNAANIGDLVLIGGVGAYCASMSARGYNGFPHTKEVVL